MNHKITESQSKIIDFEREKVCLSAFVDLEHNVAPIELITNQLMHQLTGWLWSRTVESKKITYTVKPPTFMDWWKQRTQTVTIKVEAKDIIKTPPPNINGGTLRVYTFDQPKIEYTNETLN